jgi:hypothetical protein
VLCKRSSAAVTTTKRIGHKLPALPITMSESRGWVDQIPLEPAMRLEDISTENFAQFQASQIMPFSVSAMSANFKSYPGAGGLTRPAVSGLRMRLGYRRLRNRVARTSCDLSTPPRNWTVIAVSAWRASARIAEGLYARSELMNPSCAAGITVSSDLMGVWCGRFGSCR